MGKKGGAKKLPNSESKFQNPITLREEATGKLKTKPIVNTKSHLRIDHLKKLAVWATTEPHIPSLSAFYGQHLATVSEAAGVPPDPSLITCQRIKESAVLMGQYDRHNLMLHNVIVKPYDSSLWKNLVQLWPSMTSIIFWMIRNGECVRAWEHCWLTEGRRSQMHIGTPYCHHCQSTIETTLHVLRDCPLAMIIWVNSVDVQIQNQFFDTDLNDWIELNINKPRWVQFWATGCHALWTWRNKLIHDESFIMPLQPWKEIHRSTQLYEMHSSVQSTVNLVERVVTNVRWLPLEPGWVRINTDGASKGDEVAGCGGMIKGEDGSWICGFTKGVGVCSAYVAELWGVLEALQIARARGFRQVELHVDSLGVVSNLQAQHGGRAVESKSMFVIARWLSISYDTFKLCALEGPTLLAPRSSYEVLLCIFGKDLILVCGTSCMALKFFVLAGFVFGVDLFCCQCETILHPGFNSTVRIEKNRSKAKHRNKKYGSIAQNNVVYKCHFCSHQNLKRGTPKGHLKKICPIKDKPSFESTPATKPIVCESSKLEKHIVSKDEAGEIHSVGSEVVVKNVTHMVGPDTTPSTSTPTLLEGKKRSRSSSTSKNAFETPSMSAK
ncbi:3-ketoacyl-CoA synthase, partial [Trifolium pratense]